MSDITDLLGINEDELPDEFESAPDDYLSKVPHGVRDFRLEGAEVNGLKIYGKIVETRCYWDDGRYKYTDDEPYKPLAGSEYAAVAVLWTTADGLEWFERNLGTSRVSSREAMLALSRFAKSHGGTGNLVELDDEGFDLRTWHALPCVSRDCGLAEPRRAGDRDDDVDR